MSREVPSSVRLTGAEVGEVAVGAREMNRGLRLKFLSPQERDRARGGPVVGRFEILEAGSGYYRDVFARFIGQPSDSTSVLDWGATHGFPKITHALNSNCLQLERYARAATPPFSLPRSEPQNFPDTPGPSIGPEGTGRTTHAGYRFGEGDRPLKGYTIHRALGRGAFGEVYFAMSDAGKEVALKFLQRNVDVELRGVRNCMNLKSPCLVTIHDILKDGAGNPWIVMEYIGGPTLRQVLRKNPNGVGLSTRPFLENIATGLAVLHERAIVHRDLKPENIFDEDGRLKISDYGLSKIIGLSEHSGQTMGLGSIHYMAPEIGWGKYGPGVDIYSLGVIAYELLTGSPPFTGETWAEIALKHQQAVPKIEILPEEFQNLVSSALEKEPEKRLPNLAAFIAALRRIS